MMCQITNTTYSFLHEKSNKYPVKKMVNKNIDVYIIISAIIIILNQLDFGHLIVNSLLLCFHFNFLVCHFQWLFVHIYIVLENLSVNVVDLIDSNIHLHEHTTCKALRKSSHITYTNLEFLKINVYDSVLEIIERKWNL